MILNGNERGNAQDLARHLLNSRDNDHVELHELRGFVADDLHGALREAEAIALGTKCVNHLFSLSLNPPEREDVPVETFEAAIYRIEGELGLEGQPRAVVFHEKEGRRHCHAVWSKIDGEEMKAIPLPYYKRTLNGIARDLYLEHGWEMPKGFRDRRNRDPLAFTQAEYQQAKRTKQDPKALKAELQACWSGSDTKQAFQNALRERGYILARGDRRGFVALDWRGEVYSLSRMTGAKAKEMKARLGDPKELQSTDAAKAWIAQRVTPKLKAWAKEAEAKAEKANLAAQFQREQMVQRHRKAREQLKRTQADRWLTEERQRAARTPRGLRGLWGWITGRNKKIRQENEAEMARAQVRDRAEKQKIIQRQLAERRTLQRQIVHARKQQAAKVQELNRDVAKYMMMGGKAPVKITKVFERETRRVSRAPDRHRERDRDRGPDFNP